MRDKKLQKAVGENTCIWCFMKDDTVLHHVGSDTYWHDDCLEAADDTALHIINSLSPKNNYRS
jgi:L-arabinose isomerase